MWFDTKTMRGIAQEALRGMTGSGRSSEAEVLRPSLPHVAAAKLVLGTLTPMVKAARLVDDVAYRDYRRQRVQQPLFIVANARSGTTFLHHLISLDAERYAPMKLHHTVFPSVALQRGIQGLSRVDHRWLGSLIHRLVDRSDRFFFKAWEDIHPTGLNQLEEDEAVFVYTLLSPGIFFVFPFVAALARVAWMDRLDEKTRHRLMDYYLATARRHLFASGGNRTLLNKSIWHPPRMQSMLELFPDARFVYLMRHPYQTIPSFLNFFHSAWTVFYPQMRKDSPQLKAMAQLAIDYYRYAHQMRARIPAKQLATVQFADLIADPESTVRRIYQHFGMQVSDQFAVRLRTATMQTKRFKSSHDYSLEEFGLTRKEVYEQLRPLFDEYGYDPEDAAPRVERLAAS